MLASLWVVRFTEGAMDELLRLQLEDIRAIIGHPIERMTTLLATLNPKQEWVMWVQLIELSRLSRRLFGLSQAASLAGFSRLA